MTDNVHHLQLPLEAATVRALAVGDLVTLTGDITVSIGLPTHRRMAEDLAAGRPLPLDLSGGAFFHLSAYIRDAAREGDAPQALYMNPSTSTRYNQYMPTIIRSQGLRLVGGKGGLDAASVQAMQEAGCAYLSFLGGGCTLLSRAIRGVVSSHWNEYISQFRLVTLRVEELGPATVAIDAHGNSVYDSLLRSTRSRLPEIQRQMKLQREGS